MLRPYSMQQFPGTYRLHSLMYLYLPIMRRFLFLNRHVINRNIDRKIVLIVNFENVHGPATTTEYALFLTRREMRELKCLLLERSKESIYSIQHYRLAKPYCMSSGNLTQTLMRERFSHTVEAAELSQGCDPYLLFSTIEH